MQFWKTIVIESITGILYIWLADGLWQSIQTHRTYTILLLLLLLLFFTVYRNSWSRHKTGNGVFILFSFGSSSWKFKTDFSYSEFVNYTLHLQHDILKTSYFLGGFMVYTASVRVFHEDMATVIVHYITYGEKNNCVILPIFPFCGQLDNCVLHGNDVRVFALQLVKIRTKNKHDLTILILYLWW